MKDSCHKHSSLKACWHPNLQMKRTWTHCQAYICLSCLHTLTIAHPHAWHHSGHILHWVESLRKPAMLWSPALPSGDFKEAPLLSLFFTPQTATVASIANWTADTCKATQITQIWSSSSCLASSHPSQRFRHEPPPFSLFHSLFPTDAVTALFSTLYPSPPPISLPLSFNLMALFL